MSRSSSGQNVHVACIHTRVSMHACKRICVYQQNILVFRNEIGGEIMETKFKASCSNWSPEVVVNKIIATKCDQN